MIPRLKKKIRREFSDEIAYENCQEGSVVGLVSAARGFAYMLGYLYHRVHPSYKLIDPGANGRATDTLGLFNRSWRNADLRVGTALGLQKMTFQKVSRKTQERR